MVKKLIALLSVLTILFATFSIPLQAESKPTSLPAPVNLSATLKYDSDEIPYFELKLDVPQLVKDIDKKITDSEGTCFDGYNFDNIYIEFDYKYGNYDWNEGESAYWNTTISVADLLEVGYYEYYPFDSGKNGEIDIKAEVYNFRARFYVLYGAVGDWMNEYLYSPYSDVVQIGNTAFYQNASDWAKGELQEAHDLGLIPEILIGADMTKPITREEFAELSVLLYEKASGKDAPIVDNPFTDTNNPQIVKAYALEITKGSGSPTTFKPQYLITREECATMLFRCMQAIAPDADYSIDGIKDFPDQKHISSWAVTATKYMANLGIIKGNANGYFMPKATTTAEEATGYGTATREAAILMAIRTYKTY